MAAPLPVGGVRRSTEKDKGLRCERLTVSITNIKMYSFRLTMCNADWIVRCAVLTVGVGSLSRGVSSSQR